MTDPGGAGLVGRLAEARERIGERIAAAGGAEGSVRIVAVSKTHPASTVAAAVEAGFTDFGESYAAEFAAKAAELAVAGGDDAPASPTWHFIGQLQTNKVRTVAPFVSVFLTIDRPSLVTEVARRSPGATVLVQINLAGVEGRGGASFADAPRVIDDAGEAGLAVIGLMGVAPLGDDASTRAAFARLRATCDHHGLPECSMGMSDDLEIAVAEGSTMVRIGSAIFGNRS